MWFLFGKFQARVRTCMMCLRSSATNHHDRSDALRKHWKSCTTRQLLGEAIPAQLPPGRRRRACDNCASLKQGCDLNSPCGNCVTKSQACSYVRASDSNSAVNGNKRLFDYGSCHFQFESPIG